MSLFVGDVSPIRLKYTLVFTLGNVWSASFLQRTFHHIPSFPFLIAMIVQYADVSLRGACPVDHSVTPTLPQKVKNYSGI